MIDVIPGILEKEWARVEERLLLVAPHVEWVQIDIADNTLVQNTTILDFSKFGTPVLKRELSHLSFEAHLMVVSPEKYLKTLVDNGFKRIIAHVEAHDPRVFFDQAQYEHVEVGIAIDGATELEVAEPFLDQVDTVLVMTIEAGFSGQPFLEETTEKIRRIHEHYPDLPIEVDGGINDKTARIAVDAGATRLVSTSFIYNNPDGIPSAIEQLKDVSSS
ncbi:MAG TPA: ribulose-phosphate 3-epimerase [Patescibacteria group bacterium]|jgi:ribulose-phosphate 3-epimerase|nr:ribulose-phosphate 3-epimerase [Patescibacteria group bacterium]